MTETKPSTIRTHKPLMRRWSTWIALGLGVLLTIVAAIPSILGSKWLYQRLVDQLAIEGFRLNVDSAEFSWFNPLGLRGIRLEQVDAPGGEQTRAPGKSKSLLSIESIASNRSLLGYLFYGRDLGKITIIKPKLDVELLENSSNIEKLVRSIENSTLASKQSSSKSKPKIDLQVIVDDLSVEVRGQETGDDLLVIPPVDLDLRYQAIESDARLVFAPTTLLDQVQVTQELVRLGLGRAIPLLAKSAWFDGRISLHVDKLEIPLEEPALAKGRAEMTLHEVRSGPSEPIVINILDMISKFRKTEIPHELVFIDGSIIQVQLADGRVEHQGVQVGLPKIDQRLQLSSAGSVGLLDKEIQVGLGIPVPLEMLARRESVQQIGIPQVTLPIRGTLDAPYVDLKSLRGDSADLLSLVSAALGDEAPGTAALIEAASGLADGKADEAISAAVDLIKELRQRRQDRKARSGSGSEPGANPPNDSNSQDSDKQQSPKRPLRDALKNILGSGSSGGS